MLFGDERVCIKRHVHPSRVMKGFIRWCHQATVDACLGADCAKVARSEWLWEDAGVNETEGIPLSRRLGLEVPEDPALGVGLEGLHLGLDVAAGVLDVR